MLARLGALIPGTTVLSRGGNSVHVIFECRNIPKFKNLSFKKFKISDKFLQAMQELFLQRRKAVAAPPTTNLIISGGLEFRSDEKECAREDPTSQLFRFGPMELLEDVRVFLIISLLFAAFKTVV